MTLTNFYMQNISSKPTQEFIPPASSSKAQSNGKGNEKFGSYLNNIEGKKTVDNTQEKNNIQNKKASAKTNFKDKNVNENTDAKPVNGDPKAEHSDNTKVTENVVNNTVDGNTKEYTEADFNEASEEMIEKLAAELGISVEAIQQILAAMNIKPLELEDPATLNSFVQKLSGVESTQELLNVPNVSDVFNKINSVMVEFEDIAAEFLQKIENEEIGRPKFVDSEIKEPQVVFASMPAKKEIIQTETSEINADANNIVDAPETEEIKITNTNNTGSFNQAFNDGSANDGAEEGVILTNEQNLEINILNTNSTNTTNVEFEKMVLKNESIRNINTEDVINQIAEKIKVDYKGDTTEIKVNLRPEHLGDVTLKIKTQNGIVTAQFVAENQRVKEILESGFNGLKEVLQEKGINVSQLSVSVGNENAERQMQEFANSQNLSSRRVNQIINNIANEEVVELAQSYVSDSQIYDINVDYKA